MSRATETPAFKYVGGELELFEKAVNWKRYWRNGIQPYVGGDVLEVGAGIGANTRTLSDLPHRSWTCLEPDGTLAAQIPPMGPRYSTRVGTTKELATHERFDSILYIDVLEHIEDDRGELIRAVRQLKAGGYVIVLSPAHQFLYTPFDRAIGHFRRYSRAMLRAVAPPELREVKVVYMDSAGMLASAANRLVLNQSMPKESQILAWDRIMIPVSRRLDPLLLNRVGKSVLGVWQRGALIG
jgi:trans-aconitate methyltransferase